LLRYNIDVKKQETKERSTKKWIFEMDEQLDEDFRNAIAKKKGLHRGVIKKSLQEAIEDWIKKPNRE
jgi:hypothetical protein